MSRVFRGYERRTIATAEVKPGDMMNFPGAGMIGAVHHVTRDGDQTVIWCLGESFGRRRWFTVRRKTTGQSTIHVKAAES